MHHEDVEIRAARADEADEVLRVLCAAFRLPYEAARPIFYQDPFFDLSHKRVLRTQTCGIVSCLTVIPTRLRVGEAWVSLGGIAGVATHPTHQGCGYANQLIAATVSAMAEELHYPLSGLFALSQDLYRRSGWETASLFNRFAFSGSPADYPMTQGVIRSAGSETEPGWAAVRALHGATAAQVSGRCLRDDRRWHLVGTAPGREWLVYQTIGQEVSGYIAWERQGQRLHLLELRASTADACCGLLASLSRRAALDEQIEWSAAPAEVAALQCNGTWREIRQEPGLMLRLVDLPNALATVHAANFASILAQTGQSLTLRAQDTLRPENNVPVRLTAAGVTRGSDSDPNWISGDIAALSPLYLGLHPPSRACNEGQLQVSSPDALTLADQLFPPRAPFVPPLDQF